MIQERLASRHVVLLGIGHTNAHVLRMWGMHAIADADLTCISDYRVATYSGMLPAVLAGQTPRREMEIDLVRLCASVNARLIVDEVTALDCERRLVQFADRPPIPFDALSIGIGSVPSMSGVAIQGDSLLKIKPMQTFLERLTSAVRRILARSEGREFRVLVVGGGVAGVEIAFCLPGLFRELTARPLALTLATRGEQILASSVGGLRRRVSKELLRRGVQVATGRSVVRVAPEAVALDDGSAIDADLVIWATGAAPPESLARLGLPLTDNGFLATDAALRSVSGAPVFAVGDTGSIAGHKLPKSGVYAVRQGPVLWQNLQRTLEGRPLLDFKPQSSFMKLVNLGDDRAIGEWKGLSFQGRWALRLKHWIDGRFMRKFTPQAMPDESGDPMQCRGCGCKLSGGVLDLALDELAGAQGERPRDDAAEIGGDPSLLASTDFFSSPFDDAYLTGRVAALHAASDLIASGAHVSHALANVVVPEGDSASQRRSLTDLLAGARVELAAMGASIVGGHTIVGPRMEVGFTVIGRAEAAPITKGNLRPGDQLYLTKPLGVGVLLAAQMRSECAAGDYESMLESMLQPQHAWVRIAAQLQIDGGTDVTGFGLAGHLLEMLRASGAAAVIRLDDVPALPGATEALQRGIESSLAPGNRHVAPQIVASSTVQQSPRYGLLFDPQTCGGLLLAVAAGRGEALRQRAADAGLPAPVCIGEVTEPAAAGGGAVARLTVVSGAARQ